MGKTLNALEDIIPLIEEMSNPKMTFTAPFPNMEKPAAEIPPPASIERIFCAERDVR